MLSNEGLISKLNNREKLSLLLVKNGVNSSNLTKIDLLDIKSKIQKLSKSVIFGRNKEINYNVVTKFIKEVFNIKFVDTTSENYIKLLDSDDVELIVSTLKKEVCLVSTSNIKQVESNLLAKFDEVEILNEKLKNDLITQDEFDSTIKVLVSFSEEDLNLLVDKLLNKLIPLINLLEEQKTNIEKKDRNYVKKEIFSKKAKFITIGLCFVYYNAFMIIAYVSRLDDLDTKLYIQTGWIIINVFFALLLLFTIPKKEKKKEEVFSTLDFEVVDSNVVKAEIQTNNTKFNNIDLLELVDLFYNFMLSKSMMLEHKKIRELFAAMASSRIIILNNKSKNDKEFLDVLNEFFDNETYYTIVSDTASKESDVFWEGSSVSDFIRGICSGNDNVNNMTISSLLEVDLSNCHLYLNSISNFAKNPNDRGTIVLDDIDYSIEKYINNRRLTISKNMWFVLFTKESSNKTLNSKLTNEAIVLDIDIISVDAKDFSERKVISFSNFLDSVNVAREENYLSNDSWEKIDELERKLNDSFEFSIENRIVRKLETYASVYNVCGNDEVLTLDSTIANVLLPVIFLNNNATYNDVLSNLKDVIEDEKILLTKEILNKYK